MKVQITFTCILYILKFERIVSLETNNRTLSLPEAIKNDADSTSTAAL